VQTPRFCGFCCMAGTLLRVAGAWRGLRINWFTVGIKPSFSISISCREPFQARFKRGFHTQIRAVTALSRSCPNKKQRKRKALRACRKVCSLVNEPCLRQTPRRVASDRKPHIGSDPAASTRNPGTRQARSSNYCDETAAWLPCVRANVTIFRPFELRKNNLAPFWLSRPRQSCNNAHVGSFTPCNKGINR